MATMARDRTPMTEGGHDRFAMMKDLSKGARLADWCESASPC